MIFSMFLSNEGKSLAIIIEDIKNRRNMGIIGDESKPDSACAPFFAQYFRQVTPPPKRNENIIV
jgi:hypothetical protein